MWKEFKEFAVKGNAFDLAVGLIVGAAFTAIVNSLVTDIIMPPIGRVMGNLDFSNLYLSLSSKVPRGLSLVEARKLGPVWAYGNFITLLINFLIISFVIFLLVKGFNRLKRPHPSAVPVVKECPSCTMSIPIKAIRCPHCTTQLGPPRT